MAGLTPQGFVTRRQDELLDLMLQLLESSSAWEGVNVRSGPVMVLMNVVAEQLATLYEAGEDLYWAAFAHATGVSLDQVSALTGTTRRGATRSTVTADVTLDAGATLPAGSVAAMLGQPDVQFRSVADVTNPTGGPSLESVVFEALEPGPVALPANQLTVIVTPVSGWLTIDNPSAASIGKARASDEELRQQRLRELQQLGSCTRGATEAQLAALLAELEIDAVVTVYQNVTSSVDADGRPPKSFEAVIWDGPAPVQADDDAIAQILLNNRPTGIEIHGVGSSGTGLDGDEEVTVPFTRAAQINLYVDATVVLEPGTAAGWEAEAAEALAARSDLYTVGEPVYASQLICVLQELDFIDAVLDLTVGTGPSPVTTSVVPTTTQIARLETANATLGT